jgi:hypothetical protein
VERIAVSAPTGFLPGNTCAGGGKGLHPGVGKLRELLGAKGLAHEHLSDLDLHGILSEAAGTPTVTPSPSTKVTKETVGVPSAQVEQKAAVLRELRDRLDESPDHESLGEHVQKASDAVAAHLERLSVPDLKALAESLGVVGAKSMGKGDLGKNIRRKVVSGAESRLSIRQ